MSHERKKRNVTVSSIAATLLLVLVALGAALAVNHYITGESARIKNTGNTAFPVLQIDLIEAFRGHLSIVIRNMGDKPYTVDKLYLYKPDGLLAAIGEPISPVTLLRIPPKDVRTVLFYVGLLPDGKYRLKIGGHGSPESFTGTSLVYLKLSTSIPPLIVNEIYVGYYSSPTSIEIYNPTSASINISNYVFKAFAFDDTHNVYKNYSFRIMSASPPKAVFYTGTPLCFRSASPVTIIVPPKGYMVLNFTVNCDSMYGMFLDEGKAEIKILHENALIDDTGNFTCYVSPTFCVHDKTIQRIGLNVYPKWIIGDPTIGFPNVVSGINANT